jgi:hypothetical protein
MYRNPHVFGRGMFDITALETNNIFTINLMPEIKVSFTFGTCLKPHNAPLYMSTWDQALANYHRLAVRINTEIPQQVVCHQEPCLEAPQKQCRYWTGSARQPGQAGLHRRVAAPGELGYCHPQD